MFEKRKKRHDVPVLNTASLPDLIFTVLFFFIIVTHMRDDNVRVSYTTPEGTQLTRLTHKSAVTHIYIGRPMGSKGKGPVVIQVGDRIVPLSKVAASIAAARNSMSPDDQENMSVAISADRDADMQTVMSVKQALRQAGVRRISYTASNKKTDAKNRHAK